MFGPSVRVENEAAFRVMSALYRIIKQAAETKETDIALIDVGPNLGAINRAAIIAANFVVIPLAPDLYSLQGLKNLGPTLRRWREQWQERARKNPDPGLPLPGEEKGDMQEKTPHTFFFKLRNVEEKSIRTGTGSILLRL